MVDEKKEKKNNGEKIREIIMKKKLIPKILSYEEFKKILLEVGGEKATKAQYEQYKAEEEFYAEGGKYIPDEEEEYKD